MPHSRGSPSRGSRLPSQQAARLLTTPQLGRTLTAIADGERVRLVASQSLPQLSCRVKNPRLPTPDVSRSRPTLDLRLPKMAPTGRPPVGLRESTSLSSLSSLANARQERLQKLLGQSGAGGAAQEREDPGAGTESRAHLFRDKLDEIGALLTEASNTYAESDAAAAAAAPAAPPPPTAKSIEAAARRKEELRKRRAARLQEILQASGHGKNLTRVAVEEKISSLRGDEEARNDFDDYVRAMTRNRTTEDIVERNVSLISNATPAEWIAAQRKAERERNARRDEAWQHARAARQLHDRESQAEIETKIARRAADRDDRQQRARVAAVQGRCARWLALAVLAGSVNVFAREIGAGRAWLAELKKQTNAAVQVQRRWRVKLIMLRLRKLIRGLRIMRRGVYWWRLRQRIMIKRRAVHRIVDYLASQRQSQFSHRIKQFKYYVIKLQRAWRRAQLMLRAQLEVVLVAWGARDYRARKAEAASLTNKGDDFSLSLTQEDIKLVRREIAAEDLSRRRREHNRRLELWAQRQADRKRIAEMEALMAQARDLLEGPAVVMQRHMRGRITRQRTRKQGGGGGGGGGGGSAGGGSQSPFLTSIDETGGGGEATKKAGAVEKPARGAKVDLTDDQKADRRPIFKLIPSMGELAKLESKSKARQRGMAMGGGAEGKAADASRRLQRAASTETIEANSMRSSSMREEHD